MTAIDTSLLNDVFLLPRAGRYANPENEDAALPVVYGDLTDGDRGIWELPRIDASPEAGVYAFAGHPVLSEADGNSVTLYDEDGAIPPAGYAFSASSDFEGRGAIAAVSFTVEPNGAVRARGKGRAAGASLIENPVAVVEDFLVNVAGLGETSEIFDASALESARERAAAAGYRAASVLAADVTPGGLIQEVMKDFMGGWFLRKDRKVYLQMESGLSGAGSLPFGETMQGFITARQRGAARVGPRLREDIINRPGARYRYNFFDRGFFGFDDGAAEQDLKSVGVHGALGRTGGLFEMPWIRDLTTLRTVQRVIVSLFKNGPRVFEIEQKTETLLHVERGDHVSLSLDFLFERDGRRPLANQICRVLSKEFVSERSEVRFRLLDTGLYVTDSCIADGSCISDGSRTAGNDRLQTLMG